MRIELRIIYKLPVVDKSNRYLGKIVCVYLDVDSQQVVEYEIRPPLGFLFKKNHALIVKREQVLEINDKYILVDDGSIRDSVSADVAIR